MMSGVDRARLARNGGGNATAAGQNAAERVEPKDVALHDLINDDMLTEVTKW